MPDTNNQGEDSISISGEAVFDMDTMLADNPTPNELWSRVAEMLPEEAPDSLIAAVMISICETYVTPTSLEDAGKHERYMNHLRSMAQGTQMIDVDSPEEAEAMFAHMTGTAKPH